MTLNIIEESHLLSIKYDNNSLYIELTVLAVDGYKYKLFAHNQNTSPIQVQFIGLNISVGFTTYEGKASLGEIESVNVISNTYTLEGDMGVIIVVADQIIVEPTF